MSVRTNPCYIFRTFKSRGHRYLAGRAATRSIDRVPQGKNGRFANLRRKPDEVEHLMPAHTHSRQQSQSRLHASSGLRDDNDLAPSFADTIKPRGILQDVYSIPAAKGITAQRITEYCPDLPWREVLAVLQSADVLDTPVTGGPLRCRPSVRAVHFADVDTWAVEWLDGTITRSRAA